MREFSGITETIVYQRFLYLCMPVAVQEGSTGEGNYICAIFKGWPTGIQEL